LTKERVLRAAAEFADRHGIELLSMRKLGELLGVEAMSLYRHVRNKDEILDGIVDLVVGEFALPAKDLHWKRAMRGRAISAHEVLLRHPWATMLLVSRIHVGPAMFRYMDATIGCLLGSRFRWPITRTTPLTDTSMVLRCGSSTFPCSQASTLRRRRRFSR
jgi:AcrR family transcriptional regulator